MQTRHANSAPTVVGYVATEVPSETVYMALGPTFMDVGSEGTFTPNASMVPSNEYDWSMDKLFLVDPGSCDFEKILVFNDGAWYDEANDYDPECGDEPLALGTGFQTEFSEAVVTFTSSGQVHGDGVTVESKGKVYQFLVNPTGTTVNWSEITADGDYDWSMDKIFIVDPKSCDFVNILVYNGEGWFDEANDYAPWEEDLPAGEGFQTEFTEGNNICINFPAVLD